MNDIDSSRDFGLFDLFSEKENPILHLGFQILYFEGKITGDCRNEDNDVIYF